MRLEKGFLVCAPEGSRTPNLLIRSQVLYPIKLQVQYKSYEISARKRTAKIELIAK